MPKTPRIALAPRLPLFREPLKNDGMQGNEELTTELYEIVQRGGSDEVDAALRVFQRFLNIVATYEAYINVRQMLGREEPNLFVSCSKRTGWTDKGMRCSYKRLSMELNFKVKAYSIRRYVATKLNASGVDIKDIMNHLGHTKARHDHALY